MVVGGDNGAVVIALDQSSLMHTVVPAPTDFHHFIGISDRLMYASPTSTDSKTFKAVTGTYWQCDPACQEWNAIPRTPSDIPYPEINGWIPVATFPQPGEAGQVFSVYDENGVMRGSGAAAGYVLPSAVFVPRSGAWVAFGRTTRICAGRSRSMPSPTGGCSSGHCRWDSSSFGSPEPPSRRKTSRSGSCGRPTMAVRHRVQPRGQAPPHRGPRRMGHRPPRPLRRDRSGRAGQRDGRRRPPLARRRRAAEYVPPAERDTLLLYAWEELSYDVDRGRPRHSRRDRSLRGSTGLADVCANPAVGVRGRTRRTTPCWRHDVADATRIEP